MEATKEAGRGSVQKNWPMSIERIGALGGSGLVGSRTIEWFRQYPNLEIISPSSKNVNILDKDSIWRFMEACKIEVLVNFAAETDVDGAEKQRNREDRKLLSAWQLNVEGVKNLAEVAASRKVFLVNVGTNYEGSGLPHQPGPLREYDEPHCEKDLSWYGATKAIGLEMLRLSGADFAHIRIGTPFGNPESPKDFLNKMKEYLLKGYPLYVNQLFNPTDIDDFAKVLFMVGSERLNGIFHVGSSNVTNPHEFGSYVARKCGLPEPKRGQMNIYTQKVARPLNGVLDIRNTQARLDVRFSEWQHTADRLVA